jgi:hypothetical protein
MERVLIFMEESLYSSCRLESTLRRRGKMRLDDLLRQIDHRHATAAAVGPQHEIRLLLREAPLLLQNALGAFDQFAFG